ncbi:diaminopropionate ammonia-lyase [Klebsiella quasivariicola]|uniref:diaminopropionate ammonia-lyase n=1 Tax=Klebsiella quasivariicola TaxID=2026240 RepID=UPI00247A1E2A|nr:diaminopropionate ammonia-lyase [Klebsiella quasivariicola]
MPKVKYIINAKIKPYGSGVSVRFLDHKNAVIVRKFHQGFAEYKNTPLITLPELAESLSLGAIYVKDESARFGLNAFKVLGGSYAIGKYIAQKRGLDLETVDFSSLSANLDNGEKMTFVTATDGNHGRGVAWSAQQLGHNAVVYMPHGSSEMRAQNIRNHGAECTITDVNYDDAVRIANEAAQKNGWIMVQDTAWDGYSDIPKWIMQGYMTLASEIAEQIEQSNDPWPTHVILQAGVGSFAGAVCGYLVEYLKEKAPVFIVIEPDNANCIFTSAQKGDGQPHAVTGSLTTIMAGLACGEPNILSWPILRDYASCFVSVDDSLSAMGMRILASPLKNDTAITSGESGAVGIGFLYEIMNNDEFSEFRHSLALNLESRVLVVSTEGATSPDIYEQLVWQAADNNL